MNMTYAIGSRKEVTEIKDELTRWKKELTSQPSAETIKQDFEKFSQFVKNEFYLTKEQINQYAFYCNQHRQEIGAGMGSKNDVHKDIESMKSTILKLEETVDQSNRTFQYAVDAVRQEMSRLKGTSGAGTQTSGAEQPSCTRQSPGIEDRSTLSFQPSRF